MQSILDKLKDNMQVIYRRALDADQSLAKLHQQGQGKFQQVFADDAGFEVQSKRFGPYVEELARDIVNLEAQANTEAFEPQLANVVRKMELLFSTLAGFKDSLKG